MYDGLIKRKTFKEIHQDIQRITTTFENKGVVYGKNMQAYALNLAHKSKKQIDGIISAINNSSANLLTFKGVSVETLDLTPDVIIASWLFKKFDKEKVYQKTNTISYDVAKKYEAVYKNELIEEEIKHNRALPIPRVFYLCSTHSDCAQDHLLWQGRFYIDEKWRDLVKNDLVKKDIAKYIVKNNVKTYQWVIGKPVWLITRPNCRHYFKAIDTLEVLAKDVNTITRNHKLHTKEGKKETKTIKHPINQEWYKRENVEDIIKKYEERLEYHLSMWNVKKSQPIKRAIEKDRLLIKKWKEYLSKMR